MTGELDRRFTLLSDTSLLTAGDAVAAIIVVGGRYLLQQRDDKPGIWYPGYWGCFGGGIDPGETPEVAIRRELREELALEDPDLLPCCSFDFGIDDVCAVVMRRYFELHLEEAAVDALVLGEGRAMACMDVDELFRLTSIVPYDAFALFLHAQRHRIVASWHGEVGGGR